jgi:hypothetical protein
MVYWHFIGTNVIHWVANEYSSAFHGVLEIVLPMNIRNWELNGTNVFHWYPIGD